MTDTKHEPTQIAVKIWNLNTQTNSDLTIFHTHSTEKIDTVIPLADGRLVFLQDEVLHLWNPNNQTTLLLPDLESKVYAIYPMTNNRILCTIKQAIRIVDFAKMTCIEFACEDDIQKVIVLRGERLGVLMDNDSVYILDPKKETIQLVYTHPIRLQGIVEMFDGRLVVYCPNKIVILNK